MYILQEGNPLLGQPPVWGPNVEEFRKGVLVKKMLHRNSSTILVNDNGEPCCTASAVFISTNRYSTYVIRYHLVTEYILYTKINNILKVVYLN